MGAAEKGHGKITLPPDIYDGSWGRGEGWPFATTNTTTITITTTSTITTTITSLIIRTLLDFITARTSLTTTRASHTLHLHHALSPTINSIINNLFFNQYNHHYNIIVDHHFATSSQPTKIASIQTNSTPPLRTPPLHHVYNNHSCHYHQSAYMIISNTTIQ